MNRTYVWNRGAYIRAVREYALMHDKLIRVEGTNVISICNHKEPFREIIKDFKSFYYFKNLIPMFSGNVIFFKLLRNGDVYFKI